MSSQNKIILFTKFAKDIETLIKNYSNMYYFGGFSVDHSVGFVCCYGGGGVYTISTIFQLYNSGQLLCYLVP